MNMDTRNATTALLQAKRRDVRRMAGLLVVILLVVAGAATFWIVDLTAGRNYWRGDAAKAWAAHSSLADDYKELYDEFVRETGHLPYAQSPDEATSSTRSDTQPEASGPAPIPGPAGPVGPTGPQGEDGKDGADGKDGKPGRDGEDGESIVGAQGAPGADGQDGAPGKDGESIVGPQGEPGAPGKDGKDGAAGKDGRGIASIFCDDAGVWQVTWTDGATAEAGQCRVIPEPEPEPTYTPEPLPLS